MIPSKKQNFSEIYFEFRHKTQKFIEIFQKNIEKGDSKKQLCHLICEQRVKVPEFEYEEEFKSQSELKEEEEFHQYTKFRQKKFYDFLKKISNIFFRLFFYINFFFTNYGNKFFLFFFISLYFPKLFFLFFSRENFCNFDFLLFFYINFFYSLKIIDYGLAKD